MNIQALLNNNKIKELKPSSFKAYFYLKNKAGESRVIQKFSIRGTAKEWAEDPSMNLASSKDTVKTILTELEKADLVTLNKNKRELTIQPLEQYKKSIKVDTDPKTGDGFINLEEFKDIVDITKVVSYKLIELKPGEALSIEFYDKDGNKLKTKE